MTFSTINLTGERVLVRGTDVTGRDGETILDARQWNDLSRRDDVRKAQAEFDQAVEQFFAPIVEAGEQIKAKLEATTEADPITYVVIEEAQTGGASRPEQRVTLTHDSVVLRLIEQGNTDRLVWVGEHLEIMEAQAATASAPSVPATAVEQGDPFAAGPAEGTQG